MIVADVNLLVYLFVRGPWTSFAEAALVRDPVWVTPPLYRYELLNVMATNIRAGVLTIDQAKRIMEEIERTVRVVADPDRTEVLRTSVASRLATFDCEYVVLAGTLGTRIVTADKGILSRFRDNAISIEDFAAGH